MLPTPSLSATIDFHGHVTIVRTLREIEIAKQRRAEQVAAARLARLESADPHLVLSTCRCSRCGAIGHSRANRRCPKWGR